MTDILILLGSSSDLSITPTGVEKLKEFKIPFSLRIASAHRSPNFLEGIVKEFEAQDGKLIICVAGKSAHLAGVVASLSVKPVIAVPVATPETAGFDSLLSMSQMPAGVPVATMGFGKSGFTNAALFCTQILGLNQSGLTNKLSQDRATQVDKVKQDDLNNRIDFKG
jgi:phosphoribosylaminoimidazole carboxylase PurE protein